MIAGTGCIDGSPATVKQPVAPRPSCGWSQDSAVESRMDRRGALQKSTGTATPWFLAAQTSVGVGGRR